MATIDRVENAQVNKNGEINSPKKTKRKHKPKSLTLSSKSASNCVNTDKLSLSAECDNVTKPRFSFRKFGYRRSRLKSETAPETTSPLISLFHCPNANSNSSSSGDCSPDPNRPSVCNASSPNITNNHGEISVNSTTQSKSRHIEL